MLAPRSGDVMFDAEASGRMHCQPTTIPADCEFSTGSSMVQAALVALLAEDCGAGGDHDGSPRIIRVATSGEDSTAKGAC